VPDEGAAHSAISPSQRSVVACEVIGLSSAPALKGRVRSTERGRKSSECRPHGFSIEGLESRLYAPRHRQHGARKTRGCRQDLRGVTVDFIDFFRQRESWVGRGRCPARSPRGVAVRARGRSRSGQSMTSTGNTAASSSAVTATRGAFPRRLKATAPPACRFGARACRQPDHWLGRLRDSPSTLSE
jgi:hypothetical protein